MSRHQKKTTKKPQMLSKSAIKESSIRIIAGQWRGRKLKVLNEDGLRPTGDRQREILFNWLMTDIQGARVLDLFAGSGALGFEALSRGAQSAVFIDNNTATMVQLENNINTLCSNDTASATTYQADALQWIKSYPSFMENPPTSPDTKPYDIIFIDPPFSQNLWHSTLEALDQYGLLPTGTLIYLEHPATHTLQLLTKLSIRKTKRTGSVCMNLIEATQDTSLNSR